MRKRIVILTVSIGAGHQQVSEALKEEWEERGMDVEIQDVFALMNPKRSARFKGAYFHCIQKLPTLWDLTYRLTDKQLNAFCLRAFLPVWWRELIEFFHEREVDAIVGTHPLATQLGIVLKRRLMPDVKLFSVLTDFSTHSMGLSRHINATFVADEKQAEILSVKSGGQPVYGFGIPLRKAWDVRDKEAICCRLKLAGGKPVVVISGGGEGLAAEEQIVSMLERDSYPLEVFWFKGRGKEVYQEPRRLENGTVIHYMAFSSSYSDYVKVADLLISKPGGVSMAEALYWNIPTGLISPLPGQERINQSVLQNHENMTVLRKDSVISQIISECTVQGRLEVDMESRVLARKMVVDEIMNVLEGQVELIEEVSGRRKKRRWWQVVY